MQQEFNDRVAAQRSILRVVNSVQWPCEQLFGLSSKAIDRWATANKLDFGSRVMSLLRQVSAKLFFLANRSQEQISEEYQIVRSEIIAMCNEIEEEMRSVIYLIR
jgi:hypothetical protein